MSRAEQIGAARKIRRQTVKLADTTFCRTLDRAAKILDRDRDGFGECGYESLAVFDGKVARAEAVHAETLKAGLAAFNATLKAIDATGDTL